MNNEIRINAPEGMEIDKENSTFECIKFKPKWIPKRGDIATAGSQIILVSSYIKNSDIIGFDVMSLAVLDVHNNLLTIWEHDEQPLWVEREASASEKKLLIDRLNKEGYVYDPNDPRVIYKKEKELPKTWEEFCENNPIIKSNEYFVSTSSDIAKGDSLRASQIRNKTIDGNLLPSKEYAEAMLALCKLIQLRDCYNGDWKANWLNGDENKYTIIYYAGEVLRGKKYFESALLNFKTEDLRETFYNNFKDLIEQAKLLL